MLPSARRKFGRVDLEVSSFAFGTAPVGNIFREIDEETSDAMFRASWEAAARQFLAVLVEGQTDTNTWGGKTAGPVAKEMLETWWPIAVKANQDENSKAPR